MIKSFKCESLAQLSDVVYVFKGNVLPELKKGELINIKIGAKSFHVKVNSTPFFLDKDTWGLNAELDDIYNVIARN